MRDRLIRSVLAAWCAAVLAPGATIAQEPVVPQLPELPKPQALPTAPLAPDLPTVPIRRGQVKGNEKLVDASVLPRDKAPQLDYQEQSGNFSIGQTLTGQTSGATATIQGDADDGVNGTLTLSNLKGTFEQGEAIADPAGGSATVKAPMREGIWVLDFAYKPVRLQTVEIPGKGRRNLLYLYYRVINRTGKPRLFVPQFRLVTDSGKSYDDRVIAPAIDLIRYREDPAIPLLGAVTATGTIPPSEKQGVDDAVYGVAVWELDAEIAKADAFKIYVRGLSDGYQLQQDPGATEPSPVYKTLRLDFVRPGDDINFRESEIRMVDPPYEWIYY